MTFTSLKCKIDSCGRGQIECENGLGETNMCCNDKRCDLDRIKSLPWDETLGVVHSCYKRCNESFCMNTSKNLMN